MEHIFLLHTHSILAFILAITQAGMLIFLLRLKQPTQIRSWMLANYTASIIWQIDQVFRGSIHPSLIGSRAYKIETVFIQAPALAVLVLSYLQILYLFLYQPYEKERKLVVKIVVPVIIGLVCINAWNEFGNHSNLMVFQLTAFLYGLVTNIWALVISWRKYLHLKKTDQQASLAHKLLLYVNMGFITMCIVAVAFGFYNPVGYWTYFVLIWLCNLAQIVVYISFSAVPASFQIKIAGFSFVTVVTFLTVVTLVLYPPLVPTDISGRLLQQEGLSKMFIIIAGAAVFVVSVLPGLLRKSISQPLQRLLNAVKQVNAGDLSVQVPLGSPDEIGDLTKNFNSMTASLQLANDQLLDYAERLEIKVAERTAALEQSLQTLKNTQAQLIQSEKMASLGELTAGIAHEIQNPLNFVNNFSEVSAELLLELKESIGKGDYNDAMDIANDLVGNLNKIANHGGRAAAIVKSMLEHAKVNRGERQAVNVNTLCQQYAQLSFSSMLAKDASFSCALHMDLDSSSEMIHLKSQDIGRVLQNLFNNALYAVNERRQTALQTGQVYEPQIWVNTRFKSIPGRVDKALEVKIRDNGTGMSEEVKGKVFQPFFTTKPAGQGTGLGLSISYDIITKGHNGLFNVSSTPGEGTEMLIQLPVLPEAALVG